MLIENLTSDAQFFYDNAGYSYDPKAETPTEGRTLRALNLAAAEGFARAAGVSFEWVPDPYADEPDQWGCKLYDAAGQVQQSLWAIDFGPGGSPWGDPYRRVVEAELSAEYMAETMEAASK